MSEREITLREDELFNLWKQDSLYKDKTRKFVTDGVFNVDAFLAQKTKIVFVLKEAVAEEGVNGFDLRDAVGGGKYHTTWNNITRWTRVILDNGDDDKTSWEKLKNISAKDRESALGNIAAKNIKKTYGSASSKMDETQQYA